MVIVAIHGQAGSGKTTLGRMLAIRLGLPFFDMGEIRKRFALERGMTLAELNALGEKDPSTDLLVEDEQQRLAREHPGFVITCRAGFHFLPGCIAIYLRADYEAAARRVLEQDRKSEPWLTVGEAMQGLRERDESDALRFKRHYGLDINDPAHYSLIIDSTRKNPLEKFEIVLEFLEKRGVAIPA